MEELRSSLRRGAETRSFAMTRQVSVFYQDIYRAQVYERCTTRSISEKLAFHLSESKPVGVTMDMARREIAIYWLRGQDPPRGRVWSVLWRVLIWALDGCHRRKLREERE